MGKSKGTSDPFPSNSREARRLIEMEEAALNRAMQRTAELNLFDVQTPFGSREFQGVPGSPDFLQIETLSPFRQQMLDFGQQQFGGFQDMLGSPVGGTDLSQARSDVEQAFFERGQNLLQPTFEREQSRLENQLIQRGLPRSGEAFGTEQDLLTQRQDRALENLALQSIREGGAEQSRLIAEDLRRRQEALGQLAFFGSGGTAQPNFQPVPTFSQQAANPQGAFGLMGQNVAAQNQLEADKKAGGSEAGAGLASAAIIGAMMMCSKVWKTDEAPAEPVLDKLERLPVETWRYKGEKQRHIGPYAEDFREIFGLGNGHTIPEIDAVGICLQAIKELRAEIKELKACRTA